MSGPTPDKPRVLCVDDEPNVLEGLRRHLRREYDVEIAGGGAAGLAALEGSGPFAVVTSDLRMPEMDGVAFLRQVRAQTPDTVRVLLTGNADLSAAVAAVNEGHIFRFLTKPCPPETLAAAVDAAVAQHRLVTAERVLLEQTLRGSIQALTEILAVTNPAAFGRATRAKQLVTRLIARLGLADGWAIEVAAMLSQIGCVTLPSAVAEKLYHAHALSEAEQQMVARLPAVTEKLLGSIPRLEMVRDILAHQHDRFDGGRASGRAQGPIPPGALLLKIALDWDTLQAQEMNPGLALDTLRGRQGWYDPAVLQALAEEVGAEGDGAEIREILLRDARVGMVLMQDVTTRAGVLMIARGQEITEGLHERIHNFSDHLGIREPVRVALPVVGAKGAAKDRAADGPPRAGAGSLRPAGGVVRA
jgi:response regulator RpfG family c-di-GMP phosphodiesterase